MIRGINRQNIFEEEKDYQKLTDLLIDTKKELDFKIYAYCFMPNHGHFLIQEKEADGVTAIHQTN